MSNNDNQRTYKNYNLQKYFIEVKLHNPDGDELILNPEAMLQLVIEDDLHFWPIRGFFIYENPFEIIERKMSPDKDIENSQLDASTRTNLKNLKPYVFRNDGKDYLDITIRPEVEGDTDLPIKKLDPKLWELKFNCVIYDKEDIEVQDITKKLKKFYFWDRDYQKMIDKHIQWSTATSDLNETKRSNPDTYLPSQATDDERKMYTGDAIKSILIDSEFQVNTDLEKFDRGSSKIFYTTFHDYNIWDNIEYILKQHISTKSTGTEPINESDICIFSKDRYNQTFDLTPINKIFKKAGNNVDIPLEYQLEHLFFDETGNRGVRKYATKDESLRKNIFRFSPVAQPAAILRKSCIDEAGKYDLRWPPAEDLDMSFRIGSKHKFANLAEIIIKYREHGNSATFKRLKTMELNTINIRKIYSKGWGYHPTFADYMYNVFQYISIFIVPPKLKIAVFNKLRNSK